jgi:hypothetical protein
VLIILAATTAARRSHTPLGPLVLVVAAVALIPVFRLLAFRCPRCGDYFTSPPPARVFGFVVNPRATPGPFNQQCYSCGIAVGTTKAAVEAAKRTASRFDA